MRKHDLGCPESFVCEIHAKLGKEVPCSRAANCKNFIDIEVPQSDSVYVPRLRHVMRLEAMVSVGCHFRQEDLTPEEWDEMITLSGERNRLEEEISRIRMAASEPTLPPDQAAQVAEARKQTGIPAPGQSLFK